MIIFICDGGIDFTIFIPANPRDFVEVFIVCFVVRGLAEKEKAQ